ncbi:LysR family transcriptional regulator [Rhodobacteraceae bacterium RKSG542]|uniref:LysR family transcriptional regulator n=1 Tax=Pseudovibrio flavus TaxID=2529854 RepID=UPI0012BC509E|nr:LysR family transcriptional regulator [Pseudovibrio flavus]MTI17362.1 LysR family transcriptional regulator [Pseudovibrio flavus]
MYSLEYLRMFVEAARTGSFSAAARKIGKAQSAVSQGIASLEIDLDCQLFDRSSRSPVLTKKGRALLPMAEAMVQLAYDLEASSAALSEGDETRLTIALDEALLLPQMQQMFLEFSENFPVTELVVQIVASPDVQPLVVEGQAQVGMCFTNPGIPREHRIEYLGSLPFVVAVAPSHPLAMMEKPDVDDLVRHRQLIVQGVEEVELSHFPQLSVSVWRTNTFFMLKEFTKAGVGWGYVPLHMVEPDIEAGLLQRLDVKFDRHPWLAAAELITPKSGSRGPASQWITDRLKSVFDQDPLVVKAK